MSIFEPDLDLVSHFEFDLVTLLDFEVEDQVLVPVAADTLKIVKNQSNYVIFNDT